MPSRVPGAAEARGLGDTWRTVVDQGLQLRKAEPWRCGEGEGRAADLDAGPRVHEHEARVPVGWRQQGRREAQVEREGAEDAAASAVVRSRRRCVCLPSLGAGAEVRCRSPEPPPSSLGAGRGERPPSARLSSGACGSELFLPPGEPPPPSASCGTPRAEMSVMRSTRGSGGGTGTVGSSPCPCSCPCSLRMISSSARRVSAASRRSSRSRPSHVSPALRVRASSQSRHHASMPRGSKGSRARCLAMAVGAA